MKKKIILITVIAIITGAAGWIGYSKLYGQKKQNSQGLMDSRINFVSRTSGKTERFITALEDQLKENPSNAKLSAELGAAYLQRARETSDPEYYNKAEHVLQNALDADNTNFEAMYLMGTLCLSRHQFKEALEWGIKAKNINPDNAPLRSVIYDAQIETGKYDEAIKTVQEMVDMRPDLTSYSRISYIRELKGDIKGAIEAMKSAINAGSPAGENTAWCRIQLGNLYLNSGDDQKAEQEYQEAAYEFPGYVHCYGALAKLQLSRGNYNAAIELLKQAIQISALPEYIIMLGDAYTLAGQKDNAEEQYSNVKFINTMYKQKGIDTDMELALFEAEHNKNLEEALELAKKSFERRPSVKGSEALAWTYYKMGNFNEAEKNINDALALGTKDPLLYYHAGIIYRYTGHLDKSIEYMNMALKINPYYKNLYSE